MAEHRASHAGSGQDWSRNSDNQRLSERVSAREAATMLGLSERTIRRAIRRGELEATKDGRAFAITREALDRYGRRHGGSIHRGRSRTASLAPRSREPPILHAVPRRVPDRLHILPQPLTRLIDREREVAAVSALLGGDIRLLTLTGTGGVGKTRLALRVAAAVADDFTAGVAFVSLAAVRSPNLVLPTIARTLGVRSQEGAPPLDRLIASLHDRHALLVLDNLEQVIAVGPALCDLLVACPRLTILSTSRSPLHLSGEHVFTVPPLSVPADRLSPGASEVLPLDELRANAAIRLFCERAAAAGEFALTADNAASVSEICRRTDGLPLAIELAAARTRVLSPNDLLARMAHPLPVLTGGPRDQPQRLRSMNDAIGWSHDLLSREERALFRRLAVFVGGFTLEAAEHVGSLSPFPPSPLSPSVFDLLGRLVDKSLVQRGAGPGGETRYEMLETVREYGLERLAESGEETNARHVHADWCVAFAERAEPEFAGPDFATWVARIESELGNMRAAHAWLIAKADVGSALRLGGALGWFWASSGHFQEGRDLFEQLIAMPKARDAPAALSKVLHAAGDVEQWLGNLDRAQQHFGQALAIFRAAGDRRGVVAMLRGLGSVAIDRRDLGHAVELLGEVVSLAPEAGAFWERASAANLLGVVAYTRGDYAAAADLFVQASAEWQELGDTGHVPTALANLARAALASGDLARATATTREVLSQVIGLGDDILVCDCFEIAAGLAQRAGEPTVAARLLAASAAMQRRVGSLGWPAFHDLFGRMESALRQGLGERRFTTEWAAGTMLSFAEATAAAMAALDLGEGMSRPAGSSSPDPDALTPRERDVLRLLVDGLSDKEIAAALGIALHTASNHVTSIRGKLAAPSRTAAAALALRDHLV